MRLPEPECNKCGIPLPRHRLKIVPVGHKSPYVLLCYACWDEIKDKEFTPEPDKTRRHKV